MSGFIGAPALGYWTDIDQIVPPKILLSTVIVRRPEISRAAANQTGAA
jgi:hypothetical protein